MANFPTSVTTYTTRNPGDTIPSADWNSFAAEINAIEDGYINGHAPINSSNATVNNLTVSGKLSGIQRIVTTTLTGTQPNFAPGLISGAVNLIRCNNASQLDLTGLSSANMADGTIAIFESLNSVVTFAHLSGGSSAGNQFSNIITSGVTAIFVGFAVYRFDATSNVWRLILHQHGAPISFTVGLAFGNASVGMTSSYNTGYYYTTGRMVSVSARVTLTAKGTSTGAAAITTLPYTVASPDGAHSAIAVPFYANMLNPGGGVPALTAGITANVVPGTATALLYTPQATGSAAVQDGNFSNTSDFTLSGFFYTT